MTLEVTLDPESEEVTMVLDNHLVLTAYKDANNRIVYGRGFNRIDDDEIFRKTRKVCEIFLLDPA